MGGDVDLSQRESQVLGLVAQGLPNTEISADFCLSINSGKSHLRIT